MKEGDEDKIPDDVYIQHYNTYKRIKADHLKPPTRLDVSCKIFWGPTGTGKSRKAHAEAGETFYPKISTNKWWDGYRGEQNVIIDEFTGLIGITHFLTWLDRYPTRVEVKGGGECLMATKFWMTSNIDPRNWWPDATPEQWAAFARRVTIVHCPLNMYGTHDFGNNSWLDEWLVNDD